MFPTSPSYTPAQCLTTYKPPTLTRHPPSLLMIYQKPSMRSQRQKGVQAQQGTARRVKVSECSSGGLGPRHTTDETLIRSFRGEELFRQREALLMQSYWSLSSFFPSTDFPQVITQAQLMQTRTAKTMKNSLRSSWTERLWGFFMRILQHTAFSIVCVIFERVVCIERWFSESGSNLSGGNTNKIKLDT